ncbi:baseplate J/gp47 family protein [Sphingobium sp. WTD-1]|uniref:baseplate J/gp47 family protein n=1 Tax=Sphingobium sp. WTD-1 TaxID=2979467 RepID=UPI0024DEB178|nr:baseplate J/gp47 family protein [Sphingobium sp. WTD-1]WIA55465.1 baseplate J/gp47 family protein [Sphingobium sp. WTD-1]WIA56598.1 baseplate J/gp47 family protein [Sphingobium sp. WTD-1]
MSFQRPTLTQLITRAQDDINGKLPGADSRLRRNVLDVLARVHAGAMNGLYGMIDDRARFLPDPKYPDTVTGWASRLGIVRKAAIAATGAVTLAGTNGAVAPAGSILVRADGVRFATMALATIAGGTASVAVTCEDGGAAGAMAAGQTLTFQSPASGVQAVATVAVGGIIGGSDEETIEQLNDRVWERLRNQPAGGKSGDYVRWAKEIAGVTRAWPYPNWNGLGTVKLLFVMDGREDIIPDPGTVALVAAKIAEERPVTAEVTVEAPIAQPLNFTIALTPDTAATRASVEAELRDLIARDAIPGGTVLVSRMRESISIAPGELDHVLTSPTTNQTADAGKILTFGAIAWA